MGRRVLQGVLSVEEVHQPVVRRPIQREECEVLFETKGGWAAWFAVNRMVGEGLQA